MATAPDHQRIYFPHTNISENDMENDVEDGESALMADITSPQYISAFDQQLAECERAINEMVKMWEDSETDLIQIPEHIRMIGLCNAINEDLEYVDICELLTVAIRMLYKMRQKTL